jgi:tetratricopeptide (TPR) repeat protein
MGKKSRRAGAQSSANNGASASMRNASSREPPSVDWTKLDLTKCCCCEERIANLPKYTCWIEGGDYQIKVCCGALICCFCCKKQDRELVVAEQRYDQLVLSNAKRIEVTEARKEWLEISKCPVCQSKLLFDKENVKALARLATAKHPIALNMMGKKYLDGDGVPRDIDKGIAYLTEAFEKGDDDSGHSIGQHYFRQGDYVQAKMWSADKCSPENAMAQHAVGKMYMEGQGVPRDLNKAMECFRKSAEMEFPWGTTAYANILAETGNEREALKWYLKGASDERSNFLDAVTLCQYNASVFLRNLDDNVRQAMFWWERAKRNGFPNHNLLSTRN